MDRPGGPPKAGASGVPDDLSGGGDVHGNLRGGDRQDDPVARGAENRGRAHLFDRPEGGGPGRGGRDGNRHQRHQEAGQGAQGSDPVHERRNRPGGGARHRLLQRTLGSSFQEEPSGAEGVQELFPGDGRRDLHPGRAQRDGQGADSAVSLAYSSPCDTKSQHLNCSEMNLLFSQQSPPSQASGVILGSEADGNVPAGNGRPTREGKPKLSATRG